MVEISLLTASTPLFGHTVWPISEFTFELNENMLHMHKLSITHGEVLTEQVSTRQQQDWQCCFLVCWRICDRKLERLQLCAVVAEEAYTQLRTVFLPADRPSGSFTQQHFMMVVTASRLFQTKVNSTKEQSWTVDEWHCFCWAHSPISFEDTNST